MRGMKRVEEDILWYRWCLYNVFFSVNNITSRSKWERFLFEVYFKIPFHKNK